MIHLAPQERNVLLFFVFLFSLGLVRSMFIETEVAEKVPGNYSCVTAPSLDKVDINLAPRRQLMSLPGVGERTAERIIAYRQEHGPFKSIDDLARVKGIGGKKLEKIKGFLVVSK